MLLKEFNYTLPKGLIAQYPLKKRDYAKLMVVRRKEKEITHDIFYNIGSFLPPKSLIVLNDSRVIPARLLGKREHTGGKVEIFLLRKRASNHYEALISPLWKIKEEEKIVFDNNGLFARITDKENRIVQFNKDVQPYLNQIGHVPLPPYIKRPDEKLDHAFYQTVYAQKKGSVASPTAGLHFTKALLSKLNQSGHTIAQVTLHVNYATFKPVESEDITQHKMHTEDYEVSSHAFKTIQQAKKEGQKIVAVGTTSARVLETLALRKALKGETSLFIYPGYQFQYVDILLTNFHFPYSTLLMLVHAFGGRKLMKMAYEEAVKRKYRFYSYGDCMMII